MDETLPHDDHNDDHGQHDGTDDYNEVENLSFQSGHASFGRVGHLCNLSKDCRVASGDNNSNATAGHTMRALKTDTSCLKIIVIGAINRTR